jgi:hypothetical protein
MVERMEPKIRREVERVFESKRRKLGVEARLDLKLTRSVWGPPVVGENVYGEAFPSEKPPRVWIEIFDPEDVTNKEITKTVCEELVHVKHPELTSHGPRFWGLVRACSRSP